LQAAARLLGVRLLVLNVSDKNDITPAVAMFAQEGAGALMTAADPIFLALCGELATLTERYRVPGLSPFREFAVAGGLLSYGASLFDIYHDVGIYAGRILKGENPADLPVQQVTRIKLVLNTKAARALALTIPLTLRARAHEVIE
jgi:putative ABC transport system substrate-binding protein